MVYKIENVYDASKILPWILKNKWCGVVFGQYDTETVHYGSDGCINQQNAKNYYQLFDRKGGTIVASPGDVYLIEFYSHEQQPTFTTAFVDLLLNKTNIKLKNNDLVVNNYKIGGSICGSYSNICFVGWHFSVNKPNLVLIKDICKKHSTNIPSCFKDKNIDFDVLWESYLQIYSIVEQKWNIDVPDEFASHNIALPKIIHQTNTHVKVGNNYE